MLQISRESAFQIYFDYLDYRYPSLNIDGLILSASTIFLRTQTFKAQDAMLDKWLYEEEVGGRMMVSQDGLTIGITATGRSAYEKISPYYRREFSNV